MENCIYPPEPGFRPKFLGIDCYDTLNRKKINNINDKTVRGYALHLKDCVEQAQRIRAMAFFATRVCLLNDEDWGLFDYWVKHSSFKIVRDEAQALGIESKRKALTAMIGALEYMIDMLSGEDRYEYKKKLQNIGQDIADG